MIRTISFAALAGSLASCTPQSEALTSQAISACKRPDVQDVVGKEARNMMLKANEDGLWRAALFGINLADAMAQARVSFGEVGVYADNIQSPYTQIVCSGSMQIDGSSAQAGQDIVTIPQLRWSINFTQPTQEPEIATFSIAIDPASLYDGLLVNGQPAAAVGQDRNSSSGTDATAQVRDEILEGVGGASTSNSDVDAARADAHAAMAEAMAEAEEAASDDSSPSTQRQPTDEDLYAPHVN